MALRTAGDADPASDQTHRLASFLDALTGRRTPAQIHAVISAQLGQEGHDQRIDGVASLDEFSKLWSQLSNGSPVPPTAWQKVVLPSILVFSNEQAVKANLEWATSHWLAIADAERARRLADQAAVINNEPTVQLRDTGEATVPIGAARPSAPTVAALPAAGGRRSGLDGRSRFAIVSAVIVLILVAGAMAWQLTSRQRGNGQVAPPPAAATSSHQPSPEPSTAETEAAPPPVASAAAPPPTWSGSSPAANPASPQQILVTDVTAQTIALRWEQPANSGGAAIAYFRILRDGADVGWTSHTAVTLTGLQPGTRYTFAVVAYNAAGLASAPSIAVSAVTAAADSAGRKTLATTPIPPITLGESFTVTGSGQPCATPAQVRVSLGGHPVAVSPLDANGSFTATLVFATFDKARPELPIIGTAERLRLTPGPVVLAAELDGQPQCTTFGVAPLRLVVR